LLVYVTGISGSGKSAVLEKLRSRGFTAHGMDEDAHGKWVRRGSGKEESIPDRFDDLDVHRWIREHDWIVDVDKVAQLKRRSDERSELGFLCGAAAGDSDVWEYFDVVCTLIVDDETIRHRVKHRSNAFGKRAEELAQIPQWNAGNAEAYGRFGAVLIDATRPLSSVVDDVVAAARPSPKWNS
jgi:broad-specificity NMP kinase